MSPTPIIELEEVTKVYPLASGDVVALDHVSLSIDEGEFVAIMGPSGSGKSTLLNQIGCLDVPTSGRLRIAGRDIGEMNDRDLTELRLRTLGYIFQKFNLIPLLTAYENVEFPYLMKHRKNDTDGTVSQLLASFGIDAALAAHRPPEALGRAAAARRDRPGPRERPADPDLRRADGQPGLGHGNSDHGDARRAEQARAHHRHGDARPRSGRVRGPHGHHPGREGDMKSGGLIFQCWRRAASGSTFSAPSSLPSAS